MISVNYWVVVNVFFWLVFLWWRGHEWKKFCLTITGEFEKITRQIKEAKKP